MDMDTTREIAHMAVHHDLFVVSDEVYHHFLYNGAVFMSISKECVSELSWWTASRRGMQ